MLVRFNDVMRDKTARHTVRSLNQCPIKRAMEAAE
jgi:hypothetical protein